MTTLREEIDNFVANNCYNYKSAYDIEYIKNTPVEVNVYWDKDCQDPPLSEKEWDTEYSFKGSYSDWLIHISTGFYAHVGETEDWIKLNDGSYEVTYYAY